MRSLTGLAKAPNDNAESETCRNGSSAQRRPGGRNAATAITAILASALVPLTVAPAYAATPPAFPEDIVVFPDRDFVSIDGYQDRVGQLATITVTRAGVVIGRAQGPIAAGSPALEANHPGGVCWGTGAGAPNVTPDIMPGDVVTAAFNGVNADSVVTQSPTVTGFTHTPGSTQLVVNGTLGAPGGPAAVTGALEQRIIQPALVTTDVARRDVRAVPGPLTPAATGGYSSSLVTTATTFTATYNFNLASSADIAAAGELRAMGWMATDLAGNRLGMTISEFGLTGGPGMGGCPQGPSSTAPNAPANVGGIPGDASLTATWSAATTIPGGSPVTGYVVEAQTAGDPNAPIFRRTVVSTVSSVPITGLTNGTPYDISVFATSAAGQSAAGTGGPVTPSPLPTVVPGAPTAVSATPGNASATVRWTAPAGPVPSGIATYSVTLVDAAGLPVGVPQLAAAGATSLNFTGLTNGTAVRFQVQATNAVGPGPFSASSIAVSPAAPVAVTAPGAPTIRTASAGNASAVANWTPPASNGGSAILRYHVRVVDAATGIRVIALRDTVATATSLSFTGLANGTAIRFQVQAINAVGTGAVSNHSNAVTPMTVPGTPAIGTATAGVSSAIGRWTAPATGGSAILRYHVRVVDSATGTRLIALRDVAGTARSMSIGLGRGTAVRFQVQAINAVGTSPVSARSNAVTAR